MNAMALLAGIPIRAEAENHRPWPRVEVADDGWQAAIDRLVDARATLFGLWGDKDAVHMALLAADGEELAVLTYKCRGGQFPSVGARHAPAIRLERTIETLFGMTAVGATDHRPWLDLGFWSERYPLGAKPGVGALPRYAFLPVEGEGLHEVPVGPVHAGIIEPGHFRFTANGEHVARLEQRLGYAHKGVESLLRGATLEHAAKIACRTSGDS